MADPIVVTTDLQEANITNSSLYFLGSVTKNGWEVTAWGFWWYKTSSGVGAQVYIASSTDYGETDFLKFSGSKDPYTSYTFRARAYFRKWNDVTEEYDYFEGFGEWKAVVTHAYCYPDNMFICNINKATGVVTFYSTVCDNDGGNCVERGFEYGNTRVATWKVDESGDFAEEVFSLQATGLALNSNFYVRPYCKSASGHVRYHGNVEASDNWLGGWRKFTTKDLNREWCALFPGGVYGGNAYEYLSIFDENGQEVDCFSIGVGHDTYQVTVCSDGIAYFGDSYGGSYRITYIRLSDGATDCAGASAFVRGITIGLDGYVYTIEGAYVYKREKITLTQVGRTPLVGTRYDGIVLDEDGYVYVVHTYGSPDRLEKYNPIHSTYDITGVVTGASSGSFTIAGDHTSEFTDSDSVVIAGSTGNNGTYPVASGGATLVGSNTVIPVSSGVPDATVDGDLTKSGSGGRIANIDSPVSLSWAGMAISGDYVYAGAYFDFPVKAPKDLSSIATWNPEGADWHSWDWWFSLGAYRGKILLEGSSDDALNYSRAIAGYDSDRNLLWFETMIKGVDGIGGHPFGTPKVTTQAVTQIGYKAAMGNGTVVSGTNITERGFEVKLSFFGTLNEYIQHSIAGFVGDVTLSGTTWIGTLVKTESETGTFSAGAFALVLGYPSVLGNPSYIFSDRLFACESYTYRARATIDGVEYYGAWVAFTTLCYGAGHQDDDTLPFTSGIPSGGGEYPSYPSFDFPSFDFPSFDFPDYVFPPPIPFVEYPEYPMPEPWTPPYLEPIPVPDVPNYIPPDLPGRYGNFYYRKAYTKKQINDLRKKCIAYTKDNTEYCLVLRHNVQVLRQFFNSMSDYIADRAEFNTLKDILPTQHLNDLYHRRLELNDFRAIINNFINNSINNMDTVNHNFSLIDAGLNDYKTTENAGFSKVTSKAKVINEEHPDVEAMKGVVDRLRIESKLNFITIMKNLNTVKATIT